MANLENYTNIYADLSQGAYTERKEGFMFAKPTQSQKSDLEKNGYCAFNFPKAKDAHGYDIVNTGSQLIKKGGEEFET